MQSLCIYLWLLFSYQLLFHGNDFYVFCVLLHCLSTQSCKLNTILSNTKLKRPVFAKAIVSNIVTSMPTNLPLNDRNYKIGLSLLLFSFIFYLVIYLFIYFKATNSINKLLHSIRLDKGRSKSNPLVLYILQ